MLGDNPRNAPDYVCSFRSEAVSKLLWSGVRLIENGLCLFQVQRIETPGEPLIDRIEKIAGLVQFALIAFEPRQAHCCTKPP